jgi:hypothetical protein
MGDPSEDQKIWSGLSTVSPRVIYHKKPEKSDVFEREFTMNRIDVHLRYAPPE